MRHRKIEHPGTVAPCNKYVRGDCPFSPEDCWWSHTEQQNIKSDSIECFICCKTYKSRNDMMIHRKKHHPNVVKQCEKYKQDYCSYKPDSCWYLHGTEVKKNNFSGKRDVIEDDYQEKNEDLKSVFQKTQGNPKPPFQNLQKKQKIE